METLLEVKDISKTFREKDGHLFKALDHVSLTVNKGECVALIGESGSGKSTLARVITHLVKPNQGSVSLNGRNMTCLRGKDLREVYRDMKMIFQEPRSSFDPRLTLGKSMDEALKEYVKNPAERLNRELKCLDQVGLDSHFLKLYPHEVSGGECQRAAIARALAQNPKLLICDEATSALDVSVQAEIISLLREIQKKENLTVLFISHDIALVSQFCDRIYVMHEGRIIEEGMTENIINEPEENYTKKLIEAAVNL